MSGEELRNSASLAHTSAQRESIGADASLISKGSAVDLASTNEDAKSSDQGTRLAKSFGKFTTQIQEKVLDLAQLVRQRNSSADLNNPLVAQMNKDGFQMNSLHIIESVAASSRGTSRVDSQRRKPEQSGAHYDNESEARASSVSRQILDTRGT